MGVSNPGSLCVGLPAEFASKSEKLGHGKVRGAEKVVHDGETEVVAETGGRTGGESVCADWEACAAREESAKGTAGGPVCSVFAVAVGGVTDPG